ncbi:MAG: ribosome maturation factor RimP [Eubacteriales bacterium]|nr:ribosome maturation factor RimP [Eubacteriales bacterium]
MKEKRSGKTAAQQIEEQAEALAAPAAEEFGTYIYDVEYVREGQEYYLNIYIDKEGGVTIGDCENVSRIVSDALDRADFIRDAYTLVVSSPGLGRALTRDRHLRQSIGQEVEVHLYQPHPETGEKDLRGILESFDEEQVVLLAEPARPASGSRKKRKGKKPAEEVETAEKAQLVQTPEGEKQRLAVGRKTIGSIRLAFDF